MSRRRGKPGDYLVTDDYTGTTTFRSRVKLDYWGNFARKIWERNLQEIATPFDDPFPVVVYRGPQYEDTTACDFETSPLFIGKTTRRFPQNSAYAQFVNLAPGVGDAVVGCTLEVY